MTTVETLLVTNISAVFYSLKVNTLLDHGAAQKIFVLK